MDDVKLYISGAEGFLQHLYSDSAAAAHGNATAANILVAEAEGSAEAALKITSRVTALVLLLLLFVGASAYCYLKQKFKKKEAKPFRPLKLIFKIKLCLFDWLCCGRFCPWMHTALAPDYMRPMTPHTLRVTLLRADNISKRSSFYFEVATQPVEGWPKVSRVQNNVIGSCDLAGETLDLDWYGDEDGIVVQVVEYCGTVVTKDIVLGDVKISRSGLQTYAAEFAGSRGNLAAGTRMFQLKDRGEVCNRQRNSRFSGSEDSGSVLLKPIYAKLVSELQKKSGDANTVEGTDQLRQEVERLRRENRSLGGTLSASSASQSMADKEIALPVMSVALRFEIMQTARTGASNFQFKQANTEDGLMPQPSGMACC